jgi:hypothetical protein
MTGPSLKSTQWSLGANRSTFATQRLSRVWIGTRSSMANGFLCDVITTFRERHADVQINARDEGSPKQASFVQKGRPDVVDVLRFRVVPNGRGTTLGGARRCSRSYRHTLCARGAIE